MENFHFWDSARCKIDVSTLKIEIAIHDTGGEKIAFKVRDDKIVKNQFFQIRTPFFYGRY